MTRKDFYGYVKKYGIAIVIAIPLLVLINILLSGKVSMFVMVVIDCVLLLAMFFITLALSQKRLEVIRRKREAFVADKEKHAQEQGAKEFEEKQQIKEAQKERVKTIKKQDRNYPAKRSKK